jgi:hypothetical protein
MSDGGASARGRHAFIAGEAPLRFGERVEDGHEAVFTVQPPPLETYGDLLRALAQEARHVDEGGDRLVAGTRALHAAIGFLEADIAVRRGGLLRPLMEVFRALHDLAQGSKSPLFFKARRPSRITKSTNLWRDLRRGQIVSVTNLLIGAGWKPNDAVKWVERETALRGILDVGGKPPRPRRITSALVSEWRAEASARRAPEATQFVADRREEHASIANREAAERRARELLDNLRRTEFPESPPDNGNEN